MNADVDHRGPVACNPAVFTKDERVAYQNKWHELEKRMIGVTEIEAGCEYRFSGEEETFRLLTEWVSLERKCCPFLTFAVVAHHEDDPIVLQLTGNEQAKTFLRSQLHEYVKALTSYGKERE